MFLRMDDDYTHGILEILQRIANYLARNHNDIDKGFKSVYEGTTATGHAVGF